MKTLLSQIDSGQSLLEIIIATGVAVLLITGLMAGASGALRTSQYGGRRSAAIKYAQEALELARSARDESWETFRGYDTSDSSSTRQCLGSDGVFVEGLTCDPNIDDVYTRAVEFDWDETNQRMLVTTSVLWQEGGQSPDVIFTTYFTRWR